MLLLWVLPFSFSRSSSRATHPLIAVVGVVVVAVMVVLLPPEQIVSPLMSTREITFLCLS